MGTSLENIKEHQLSIEVFTGYAPTKTSVCLSRRIWGFLFFQNAITLNDLHDMDDGCHYVQQSAYSKKQLGTSS